MTETVGDEIASRLENVWVQYRLRNAHHYNLKRSVANQLSRRRDDQETITALAGVTLNLPRGARLGLTGPNGSGKSTLLAVMAGTLAPSRGDAWTSGRVLALLGGPSEGLDPEQSGRENALGIGVRLGETAEAMASRLDSIRDFSGLGNRFEHPVYTYSSGMQIRLRFSTITSLTADVLLIDEGIGAADRDFAEVAEARLGHFLSAVGTLVIASHSEDLIQRHCTAQLEMNAGQLASENLGLASTLVASSFGDGYLCRQTLREEQAAMGLPSTSGVFAAPHEPDSALTESTIDWAIARWNGFNLAFSLLGWHRSSCPDLEVALIAEDGSQVAGSQVTRHDRSDVRSEAMPYTGGFRVDFPRGISPDAFLSGHMSIVCSLGASQAPATMSPTAQEQLQFMSQVIVPSDAEPRPAPRVPVLHPLNFAGDPSLQERRDAALDALATTQVLSSKDFERMAQSLREWRLGPMLEMSLFSPKVASLVIGPYFVDRIDHDQVLYFSQSYLGTMTGGLFTDTDRRILSKSRILTEDPLTFAEALPDLIPRLGGASQGSFQSRETLALGVQRWYPAYGHLHDEFFTLRTFASRFPDFASATRVNDYVASTDDTLALPHRDNLQQMEHLICGQESFNAYHFEGDAIAFQGATLIGNRLEYPTFHEFWPGVAHAVVRSAIRAEAAVERQPKIMLTRETAQYAPRNLANQRELEETAEALGFFTVNPEKTSFLRMVQYLQFASEVIVTWGSALTNLVYAPRGTRVCILKSDSYSGEDFEATFGRIASNYGHQFEVLVATENCISPARLEQWATSAQGQQV